MGNTPESVATAFSPTVSSLAEVLGAENGALSLVPPAHLALWLPHLEVPAEWVDTTVEAAAPVTRMLVRRIAAAGPADGCELLNLDRVPGRIADATVLDNADRTLRGSGAKDLHTWGVELPEGRGALGIRTAGHLTQIARDVWAQYSYYTVNTVVGAALIEQTIVIGYDALPILVKELNALTMDVFESLVASLKTVSKDHSPENPLIAAGGRALAWSHVGSIAVQPTTSPRHDAPERPEIDQHDTARAHHEPT